MGLLVTKKPGTPAFSKTTCCSLTSWSSWVMIFISTRTSSSLCIWSSALNSLSCAMLMKSTFCAPLDRSASFVLLASHQLYFGVCLRFHNVPARLHQALFFHHLDVLEATDNVEDSAVQQRVGEAG
uniref:Uncharacterized protein n=1 Tax=Rhipicephalus microplus TaxID=6941 RepID=A0A6G5A0X3_RHIMP